MKKYNFIKIFGVLFMVCISLFIYTSFHGNPIGYMKAKKNISEYIEDNYDNSLKITNIHYSSKGGGYIGSVEDIDVPRNKSTINYYNTGYIGDYYHFDTFQNMSEEISTTLINLLVQQTEIKKENVNIYVNFDIPKFKYKLNDDYSGKEPLSIELELKSKKGRYTSEDEFKKQAKEVLNILNSIKYDYKSIIIYSYREDGNSRYEMDINSSTNINEIKKEEPID